MATNIYLTTLQLAFDLVTSIPIAWFEFSQRSGCPGPGANMEELAEMSEAGESSDIASILRFVKIIKPLRLLRLLRMLKLFNHKAFKAMKDSMVRVPKNSPANSLKEGCNTQKRPTNARAPRPSSPTPSVSPTSASWFSSPATSPAASTGSSSVSRARPQRSTIFCR